LINKYKKSADLLPKQTRDRTSPIHVTKGLLKKKKTSNVAGQSTLPPKGAHHSRNVLGRKHEESTFDVSGKSRFIIFTIALDF
jgi:hypothetical protein